MLLGRVCERMAKKGFGAFHVQVAVGSCRASFVGWVVKCNEEVAGTLEEIWVRSFKAAHVDADGYQDVVAQLCSSSIEAPTNH